MATKPTLFTIITILVHHRQTKYKERKGNIDEDNNVHENLQK